MRTDYNQLLPTGIIFNLKQVAAMNIIKIDMAKKLIYENKIESVRIGNKIHISRTELIRYLEDNTIPAIVE